MPKTGETMGGSFSLIARFPDRRPVDRLVSPSKRAELRASHSLYFTVGDYIQWFPLEAWLDVLSGHP